MMKRHTLSSILIGIVSTLILVNSVFGDIAAKRAQRLQHIADAEKSGSFAVPRVYDFTRIEPNTKFKQGELIVRFANKASRERHNRAEKEQILQTVGGGRIKKEFDALLGISVVELPKGMTVEKAIKKFNGTEGILYAQPNYRVKVLSNIPNDQFFGQQWGMNNIGQSGGKFDADIDAPEAWDLTTGSREVIVAVVDTGVDYGHQDLWQNIYWNPGEVWNERDDDDNIFVDDIHGWNFVDSNSWNPMDDNGHGTHVSGIIGAAGNNGIGVAGVCWNVRIMPIKSLNWQGWGWFGDILDGIQYAVLMGADVVSNSYGWYGYYQPIKDAIDAGGIAGMLFVAAAGNEGLDNDTYYAYPASYDSDCIISVAATDRYDNKSWFSNYGLQSVDLGAPGSEILSCVPWGYESWSGTSMAAPHVAGACALLWSMYPSLTNLELKSIILQTADPIPALAGRCVSGGRLNVYEALTVLSKQGNGTASDPYQISTAKQLNSIGLSKSFWNKKHYKLVADIDLSAYNGTAFNIIGDGSVPFTGSFDGGGHTISNFTYTSPGSRDYTGLFGNVGAGGMIKNLNLVGVNVDSGGGGGYTGGLAGANAGLITGCYVAGDVSGGDFVGSLVGANNGSISNCNAAATISGANYVGELAGINSGLITGSNVAGTVSGAQYVGGLSGDSFMGAIIRCSSVAAVSGGTNGSYVGGLIGLNDNGTITDCYAKGGVSGSSNVGGLAGMNHNGGKITNCYSAGAVSRDPNTGDPNTTGGLIGKNYLGTDANSFWDKQTSGQSGSAGGTGKTTAEMKRKSTFTDVGWDFTNVWTIIEPNFYYPTLLGLKYGGGTGTAEDPYLIYTPADMNALGSDSNDWDRCFKLMADIDLGSYKGTKFKTIGNGDKAFDGIFDGNKHKISHFTYISSSVNYAGLFSFVGTEGEVKNLDLVDVNVNAGGGYYAGGLAAINYGTISNCSVAGVVSATGYVGGLAGYNFQGMIKNCYSKVSVGGTSTIGGLVGGGNKGVIINCYSVGLVSGTSYTGGLMGKAFMSSVGNSFWDTEASGQSSSAGGGTGKTTAEMKKRSTFTGWDFINIWNISEGIDYPVFKWQTLAVGFSPIKCDLAGDNSIDWKDFAVIARHWLADCSTGNCEGADLDDSNRVDMNDISLLGECWLATGFGLNRWDFIEQQLANTMNELTYNPMYANPDSNYPRSTGSDGKWVPYGIGSGGYVHWAGGFLPGSLWYMYQRTSDPNWRQWAQSWTNRLENERTRTQDHEAGFIVYHSFGLGYEITGNPEYKQVIIDATSSLMTRYNPVVGCIKSWNLMENPPFTVIIDGTIPLEMVFWASKNGGNPNWYNIAVSHATKTMQNNVRPNGSVWQAVDYDPSTGAVVKRWNKQGYNDNTTWSRGQAWGIYGFTVVYRETLNTNFLQTAQKCADYFIEHLPPDYVPYWDVNAPEHPDALQVRDSSAAAIAASGLLELSTFVSEPSKGKYQNAAINILDSLSSPAYLAEGTSSMGILLHGTGNGKSGGEVDTSLMYGDYFYIEALKRYEELFR